MTLIADMVRKLFEKGVDQEAILIAIEAAEQVMSDAARAREEAFVSGVLSACPQNSADVSADRRREKDRLRKQDVRRIPQMSADSPQNSADIQNAPLSKEEKKEVSKQESKRETTRGARLPVGWTPTDQDWAIACELVGEPKAKTELEKFIDHWKQQPGPKGVKLDWNAGWRNWIRRASEYAGGKNGVKPHLSQHQIERENSRKILNDLDQFIGGVCSEADPRLLRHDPGDRPEGVHGGVRRDVIDVPATRVGKGS